MRKKEHIHRTISYLKRNRAKVLLFLLVLSSGIGIRTLTQTRYVSYVNSHSDLQAGDFCFGSDYLYPEEDGVTYTVSNWNGKDYEVTFSVRNFENSLRWNRGGTDFSYQVYGKVYLDSECTQEDPNWDLDGSEEGRINGMDTFDKKSGSRTIKLSIKNKII